MERDRIALTEEQQEAIRVCVGKRQPRSDELRAKLEHETAVLAALAKQERADEAALLTQLDRVLDIEREVKHLHVGIAVAIRNLLKPDQQTKLREIATQGVAQLEEDDEKLNIGQDISGLMKMAAQKGMSVCSGVGNAVPFLAPNSLPLPS